MATSAETLCKLSDLVPGAGVAAWSSAGPIALFYLPDQDQTVFALGHFDPLGRANVLARGLVGDKGGELVVASPLYKHHFSLRTGRCLEDESAAVPVYPATIRGDNVIIDLTGKDSRTLAA